MNKNLDKSNLFGAAFMDLSKVFYAINHDPLIAKFEVSGFPYIYSQLLKPAFAKNEREQQFYFMEGHYY